MRRRLHKILRNYRDYGPFITLGKGVSYLLRALYARQSYLLYKVSLDGPPGPGFGAEGIAFRLLAPEEEPLVQQIEEMEEWLEGQVARRLREGAVCLVALAGQRVAGFNLISFGDVFMPLVEHRHRFPPGTAWSEQISVNRDFRGRGLATAIRLAAFEELRRRGCRRFYGGTLPLNAANLQLCRKVGFRVFVELRHHKLLAFHRWEFLRLSGRPDA